MKTIVIGLGGFGCNVVSSIYGRIDTNKITALCMDTDIVNIRRIREVYGMPGFWFGRAGEFANMSYNGYSEYSDWLPGTPYIRMHDPNQTGGLRIIGRLLFEEYRKSNICEFFDYLRRIQYDFSNNCLCRVIIVSSLIGGTGSGSVIPLALAIKDFYAKSFNSNVQVIGAFISPKTIISSIRINNRIQEETMLANAYAALKEINALNRICFSPASYNGCRIIIDDLFDSQLDRGNAGKFPFDMIKFLKAPDHNECADMLMKETADSVYALVSASCGSLCMLEEGLISAYIRIPEENYNLKYGIVGTSKIVYPYIDLSKYCGAHAIIDVINRDTAFIDRVYEKMKNEGVEPGEEKLKLNGEFIAVADSILSEDSTMPNYLSDSVTELYSNGYRHAKEQIYYKHAKEQIYYKNVYEYIIDFVKQDESIKEAVDEISVTEDQLKENLTYNVDRCEHAIEMCRCVIQNNAKSIGHHIIWSILPQRDLFYRCDIPHDYQCYNILNLVMSNGKMIHPFAAWLLLYRFRKKVEEEISNNKVLLFEYLKQVNDYKYAYKSADSDLTTEDIARKATVFSRRRFIRLYLEKSSEQKLRLFKYAEVLVIDTVLTLLLDNLDRLLDHYCKVFVILEKIKKEANICIENISADNEACSERVFRIGTSRVEMEKTYMSVHLNPFDFEMSEIYEKVYRYLLEDATGRDIDTVVEKILSYVNNQYSEVLDYDLFDALVKETEGNRTNIAAKITNAYCKALNTADCGSVEISLGVVNSSMIENALQNGFMNMSYFPDGCTIDKNDSVSNKEMYFLREKFGISLYDLTRSCDYELCEEAYNTVIKLQNNIEHVCLHIDKTWCADSALPPL